MKRCPFHQGFLSSPCRQPTIFMDIAFKAMAGCEGEMFVLRTGSIVPRGVDTSHRVCMRVSHSSQPQPGYPLTLPIEFPREVLDAVTFSKLDWQAQLDIQRSGIERLYCQLLLLKLPDHSPPLDLICSLRSLFSQHSHKFGFDSQ